MSSLKEKMQQARERNQQTVAGYQAQFRANTQAPIHLQGKDHAAEILPRTGC